MGGGFIGLRIIFIGDSLIEFFNWAERFPSHEVHNLGRAGETVEELSRRAESVANKFPLAEAAFIMSGINNVLYDDHGIFGHYRDVIRKFKSAWPNARIFAASLLPISAGGVPMEVISGLNEKLKAVAVEEGAEYMDVFSSFIMPDGSADIGLYDPDGVHLSRKGYGVWAGIIEKKLNA